MKLALACNVLFALGSVCGALAQSSRHANLALPVGVRLAEDLTWTQAERDKRFAHMDRLFPTHVVRRGAAVKLLQQGKPLKLPRGVLERYMRSDRLAGVLVLQNGRVRAERYGLGLSASGRWTAFSVTKAITDTLVGVALRRGDLGSLHDHVTRYLPELRDSAYEGVTIQQLLTMTSGVHWNENYNSSTADNVRLYTQPVESGKDPVLEYMRRLPREVPPGTRWLYNTGETDLLGVLLRRATGSSLAEQLSSAIWQHAGMESNATWIATSAGTDGEEFGGSGLSATLRDFGRLGEWVLEGGRGAVAADWFQAATHKQVKAGNASYGYGWWPQADGSFAALGIFGQAILIDPHRGLVVVTFGDWPAATDAEHREARENFWQRVKTAIDSECKSSLPAG